MQRAQLPVRTAARIIRRGVVTYRRPLVGPPDAVSNLRPVLYGPPRHAKATQGSLTPYSVDEFVTTKHGKPVEEEEGEALQWRLQQEDLEAFNQSFWTQNNARFQEAKQAALDQYPPLASTASPDEIAIREIEQEQALQEFYARWVEQERPHHFAYTREWYRRIYSSLLPGLKRQWKMMKAEAKENHAMSEIIALLSMSERESYYYYYRWLHLHDGFLIVLQQSEDLVVQGLQAKLRRRRIVSCEHRF